MEYATVENRAEIAAQTGQMRAALKEGGGEKVELRDGRLVSKARAASRWKARQLLHLRLRSS